MISNLQVNDDVYYKEETKAMLRANREYLIRMSVQFTINNLSYVQAHRYDFYRVLRQLGIPSYMHWVIGYINGIENPNQSIEGMTEFLNLDPQVVNNLIVKMNTTRI